VAREGEAYALTAEKEYLVDYTLTELEGRLGSARPLLAPAAQTW
jgi:hypothetical protein